VNKEPLYPNQVIPLSLTAFVFAGGVGLLFLEIVLLNKFALSRQLIISHIFWGDVVVGLTIYLKTSIDFAIFIGRLMSVYPGWKNRIMIEIGTALGNIVGTVAILALWDVFREVKILMAVMIVIAAFVLLRLAEDGLEHVKDASGRFKVSFLGIEKYFDFFLHSINSMVAPVLNKLIPQTTVKEGKNRSFWSLFILAFTIPFLLGLDDFAGYIPLFNIVNVFGFATGVFLGHMLLNIALFLSPHKTITAVKNPLISFFGSLAFVGLALWGLFEAAKLLGFGAH
jgi:hypothetical protein